MYYYYVLLDGRGAGWRVVGNALRAVHVRVKFFLRHRFPWKFPETVFFRASQISERISGNLDQSQIRDCKYHGSHLLTQHSGQASFVYRYVRGI